MKPDEKMYKAIAKKYGVSVEEVKREMQKAIDAAYLFPNYEVEKIPHKGETPTIDEFIKNAVDKIENE